MKVLNAEQTRNLEKNAVRSGISYLQLMENAGAAAARFIKKRFPVDQKHIVVLCGKGNNGGDGFVAARHLAELGAKVIVVLTEGQPGTEIAQEMFEKLSGTTVKTVNYLETPEIIAPMLSSADYIVDAIYGIGFHGSVPEYLHPLKCRLGSPKLPRSNSTSAREKPRTPVPSAFANASFAQKEAAALCAENPRSCKSAYTRASRARLSAPLYCASVSGK